MARHGDRHEWRRGLSRFVRTCRPAPRAVARVLDRRTVQGACGLHTETRDLILRPPSFSLTVLSPPHPLLWTIGRYKSRTAPCARESVQESSRCPSLRMPMLLSLPVLLSFELSLHHSTARGAAWGTTHARPSYILQARSMCAAPANESDAPSPSLLAPPRPSRVLWSIPRCVWMALRGGCRLARHALSINHSASYAARRSAGPPSEEVCISTDLPAFVGLRWPSLAFAGLRWPPLALAGLCWPSLALSGPHWPSLTSPASRAMLVHFGSVRAFDEARGVLYFLAGRGNPRNPTVEVVQVDVATGTVVAHSGRLTGDKGVSGEVLLQIAFSPSSP